MKRCPKCNAELLKEDAQFCGRCGHNLKNPISVYQSENEDNGSKFNIKIVLLVVIIVLLVAIIGLMAMGTVSLNQPTQMTDTNNGTTVQDNGSVEYVASVNSDKFHLKTCEWGQKISKSNLIVYPSRQAAVDGGKIPCSVCNP